MGFYSRIKQSKGNIVTPYMKRSSEAELLEFTGGVNTNDEDINIGLNQLSNAENYLINSKGRLDKVKSHTLYGNYLGNATGILWGGNFANRTGVQEQLVTYHTGMYRYVAGIWTALTGVAFTTNRMGDGAYYPSTNKFYYVNETDNVVKYTSGTSADQTDGAFIKGKFIEEFQNRLLVAKDDVVWYTDLAVDTFGANNYFRTRGNVTGIRALYDVFLTFTKNKVSRLQNFIFDGNIAGPESLIDLPTPFGTIYDRTIVVGNNRVYFLGQDLENRCHIYETDGYQVKIISEDIAPTLNDLSATQLQYACAGFDGTNIRLSVAESGQTSNNLEIIYDTIMGKFQPFRRKRVAGRADYSIYWSSETNGQWDLFAGSQSTGQVFKLDQEDYEECAEEQHIVTGTNIAIDANPAVRAAQSFKFSNYNSTQDVNLTNLYLLLRKVSGTTTELTVRIETDASGSPSGTLADTDATATISALTSTSYAWTKVSMSSVTLKGNTTYWIVVKHTTEGTGDSKYFWSGDACSPSYTNGNLSTNIPTSSEICDSYSESTAESFINLYNGSTTAAGQSFNGNGSYLNSTKFYLKKIGSPTGNAVCKIYATTGTYGTTSKPSGSALATSGNLDVSTVGTDPALFTFTFTTTNKILLTNDTKYVAVVEYSGGNSSNYIAVGADYSDVLHGGNISSYGGSWSADGSGDIAFYVYTDIYSWTADTDTDATFIIYSKSAIDAFADFKALMPSGVGYSTKLQKFMAMFSTKGSYNVEVAFSVDGAGYITYFSDLSGPSGSYWGDGVSYWGDGVSTWGAGIDTVKNYNWRSVDNIKGKTIKPRIRNRNASEPHTFNGFRLVYNSIKKQQ